MSADTPTLSPLYSTRSPVGVFSAHGPAGHSEDSPMPMPAFVPFGPVAARSRFDSDAGFLRTDVSRTDDDFVMKSSSNGDPDDVMDPRLQSMDSSIKSCLSSQLEKELPSPHGDRQSTPSSGTINKVVARHGGPLREHAKAMAEPRPGLPQAAVAVDVCVSQLNTSAHDSKGN